MNRERHQRDKQKVKGEKERLKQKGVVGGGGGGEGGASLSAWGTSADRKRNARRMASLENGGDLALHPKGLQRKGKKRKKRNPGGPREGNKNVSWLAGRRGKREGSKWVPKNSQKLKRKSKVLLDVRRISKMVAGKSEKNQCVGLAASLFVRGKVNELWGGGSGRIKIPKEIGRRFESPNDM